ncbi:MAG: NAD-dependent epimerase/dehydratase family protein [Betaproteobacteria bacterium]|nr:NAD-dependent epimerase/dehydratase family protein [Betaproteobacteria bacterium]
MKSILVTGAAGLVGNVLRAQLRGQYRLVLLDREPVSDVGEGERAVQCDIRDTPAVISAMDGVDAVVHLAGQPTEADWETIRDANIEGCYQVVEAARRVGVRRFVFASTNHVIGYYPRSQTIDETCMPRPDTRYGVSKAFGEALLRYYADKFGLTAVCLRIGTVRSPDAPAEYRHLSTWLSHGDLGRLVHCAIEADVHYEIVYGVSRNTRRWWEDASAARIGYAPVDDAETWAGEFPDDDLRDDPVASRFQGGVFCSWDRD